MKIIALGAIPRSSLEAYGSEGATVAKLGAGEASLTVISLTAGGKLGCHRAAWPQLMVVVSGVGSVQAGADQGRLPIGPGMAVRWSEGEDHETTADTDMVLLIVEIQDPSVGDPR